MAEELERERERLVARLIDLEAEHAALHDRPEDHEGHQKHLVSLKGYQKDVRAYREQLAALRRERGIPDPELF